MPYVDDLPAYWVSHPSLPRTRLKVRSLANSPFAVEVARRFDLAIPRDKRQTISKRQTRTIMAPIASHVIVDYLLVDWSGVRSSDGASLPFSREAALQRLIVDGEFRAIVVAAACRVDADEATGEIAHGIC